MGFAQRVAIPSNKVFKLLVPCSNDKSIDTLMPISMLDTACGMHLIYYRTPGGFITGNNGYGDKECAQKYYITGNATISEVLATAFTNTPSGTSGTAMKIYAISSTTKGPTGVALGTSASVPVNLLATLTAFKLTSYTFSTPVNVSDAFACSFVMPTVASDTAFVFSTNPAKCNSPDSLSWILWSNNIWVSIISPKGYDGLKTDIVLYPVVNTNVGLESSVFINNIKLSQNMPNPVIGSTFIAYEILDKSNITIEIFDLTGKKVFVSDEGNKSAGKHYFMFDSNKLQSGVYYYSLIANGQRVTKKMIVD